MIEPIPVKHLLKVLGFIIEGAVIVVVCIAALSASIALTVCFVDRLAEYVAVWMG